MPSELQLRRLLVFVAVVLTAAGMLTVVTGSSAKQPRIDMTVSRSDGGRPRCLSLSDFQWPDFQWIEWRDWNAQGGVVDSAQSPRLLPVTTLHSP
jgi:hypothetical protein